MAMQAIKVTDLFSASAANFNDSHNSRGIPIDFLFCPVFAIELSPHSAIKTQSQDCSKLGGKYKATSRGKPVSNARHAEKRKARSERKKEDGKKGTQLDKAKS